MEINENQSRKLLNDCECPFDNLLYKIIDPISILCKTLNITPNLITMVSLVPGFLSIYFLYTKQPILFGICFLVYYILDILDGYCARKYSLCTKFGDLFDHIRDLIIWIFILIILIISLYNKKEYKFIILTIVLLIIMMTHISCQELNTSIDIDDKCYSGSLNIINICPDEKFIKITKYFGIGSMVLYIIILSIYIYISKK
jgi:phosphatidylglycerophosphate synthase